MRAVRDSFLHFLADNLPGTMPVHNVRRDPSTPDSDKLQMDAVNVTFLKYNPTNQVGKVTVVVDVINDAELVAVDWTQTLFQLLSASFMTPKLDYTDPANPVTTNGNIFWQRNSVNFVTVPSDFYVRYSVTMVLHFPQL